MKHLLRITILLFFFALPKPGHTQTATKASASAVGHLDLDSLLDIMPAMKKASDSAQAYYNMLEDQLAVMTNEYQRKLNEYDSLKDHWSPLIKALKEKEITDLQNNIQAFQQQAQVDYTNMRSKLVEPIYDQITAAVKQVALARGYKYVLDSSKTSGVVLYASPTDDIFNDVRIKLNIPVPPKPTTTGTGGTAGGQ
ncbi:MAG TPA: OmpH family outer membrane protein [Bacteroidia bacterium]|jgi:outer membrane protein|nr:OmpH family outer membrane protein [Bacteroidia bacterium]